MIETVATLRLVAGLLFWLLADFILVLVWAAVIFGVVLSIVKWSVE